MNSKGIARELSPLIILDYAAARAYEEAVERIREHDIRQQLLTFRDDHNRHAATFLNIIRKLGEPPPSLPREEKGFLTRGITLSSPISGTKVTLRVMHLHEEVTNRTYADAQRRDWPGDIKTIVENNFKDEQRHLAYLEVVLHLKAVPAG